MQNVWFLGGYQVPALMGCNRPSTIVGIPISIKQMMSFRLKHAQMSDQCLMHVPPK